MKLLRAIWDGLYGLFVDDGWMASGTLLAMAAAGLWTVLVRHNATLHDAGGWVLFALLMALLLADLYVAGRNAARRGRR
jgi:hypothetical protein